MANEADDFTRFHIQRHMVKRLHGAELAADTGQAQCRAGMLPALLLAGPFILQIACVHMLKPKFELSISRI